MVYSLVPAQAGYLISVAIGLVSTLMLCEKKDLQLMVVAG